MVGIRKEGRIHDGRKEKSVRDREGGGGSKKGGVLYLKDRGQR